MPATDASNVVRVADDNTVNVKVKEEGTTDQSEVTTTNGSDEIKKETKMVKVISIDHIEGDAKDEIGIIGAGL